MISQFIRIVFAVILAVSSAGAATFTVTSPATTDDGACGGADCTIVEALNAANAAPGADVIVIDASLSGQSIDLAGLSMDPANNAALTVTDDVTITGDATVLIGADNRTLSMSAPAHITGVTFSGGTSTGGVHVIATAPLTGSMHFDNGTTTGGGGVIATNSSVSLTGATFHDNSNTGSSLALIAGNGSFPASFSCTGCTFTANTAGVIFGGVYAGSISISASAFDANDLGDYAFTVTENFSMDNSTFDNSSGGLVVTFDPVTVDVRDSSFANNTITEGSVIDVWNEQAAVTLSGLTFADTTFDNTTGMVFRLFAASAALENSMLTATGHIGAIDGTSVLYYRGDDLVMDNVTVNGFGSAGIDYGVFTDADAVDMSNVVFENGAGTQAVIYADSVSDRDNLTGITMDNVTIRNNAARGLGLFTPFAVTDSRIDNNTAPPGESGGGAFISAAFDFTATSTITGTTFTGNRVSGTDAVGAALFAQLSDNRSLTVESSTFTGNAVTDGLGGAVSVQSGSFIMRNATISGNTAVNSPPDHFGAGLHTRFGAVTLDSLTVTDNAVTASVGSTFTSGAGGIVSGYGHGGSITNSIVYGNTVEASPSDCAILGISSAGYNIFGADCGSIAAAADFSGTDPLLEPLADNGGPVATHDLAITSPAIDTGSTGLSADARGVFRPTGTADDIGAVEWQPVATDPVALTFDAVPVHDTSPSKDITITFTLTTDAVSVGSSNPEFSVTDDCTGSFAVGQTCTATVTVTPAGIGSRSGTIDLTITDDAAETYTASLLAVGQGISGEFSISPFTVDFGDVTVGDTGADTITVTSHSTAPLPVEIVSIALTGDTDAFSITNDCPATLAPGETCTVTASFAPVSTGDHSATVTVTTDDFDTPAMAASLAGSGIAEVIDNGTITTPTSSSSGGGGGGCSAGAGGGFGLLLLIGLVMIRLGRRTA